MKKRIAIVAVVLLVAAGTLVCVWAMSPANPVSVKIVKRDWLPEAGKWLFQLEITNPALQFVTPAYVVAQRVGHDSSKDPFTSPTKIGDLFFQRADALKNVGWANSVGPIRKFQSRIYYFEAQNFSVPIKIGVTYTAYRGWLPDNLGYLARAHLNFKYSQPIAWCDHLVVPATNSPPNR